MRPNDVVITGIGMVTPLGATAGETAEAWRAGACARRRRLEALAGSPLEEAEIAEPAPLDAAQRLGGRRMLKYMSEAGVLGCVAAREALAEAEATRRFVAERIGLYAATGLAAASVDDIQGTLQASIDERGEFSERLLGERGLAAANPLISFKILANMPPCLISVMEGIKGPNLIFTPWEGEAGAALLEAWLAVREGAVDGALAGAADSAAHASTVVFLRQAGLIGEEGYTASGAGYVFLERAETALRDGKWIAGVLEAVSVDCGGDGIESVGGIEDPLAGRMGRMFAAAPAVLLGLECLAGGVGTSILGTDGQRFSFRLGRAI